MKAITMSVLAAVVTGAALCKVCLPSHAEAGSTESQASVPSLQVVQSGDTATVRMHISGMTCGTCPATARKAINRLPGVYSATVTLDDSLGVVKFDPRRLKAAEIATHLTKMTGYATKVLADTVKGRKS
jgi:copper chaperone CopZ